MKARKNIGRRTFALLITCAVTLSAAPAPAPKPLDLLIQSLAKIDSPAAQAGILRGMNASLKGKRGLAVPEDWDALYERLSASPNAEVRQQALVLAVTFGGRAATTALRHLLADPKAPDFQRHVALDSLIAARDPDTLPLLLDFIATPGPLAGAAARALASYDDPRIAPALLAAYAALDATARRDAAGTLLSRAASARALLAAIDAGRIDRTAITAPLARQLQGFHDATFDAWLAKNWGAVRATSAETQAQIARFKQFLTPDLIAKADPSRGRLLFTQTCAVCHTLFGTGGRIGPELPGSFTDIDYLLQNILDPNAVIGKDYQQTFVTMKDGQVLSGIVAGEDTGTLTLKTLADVRTLQRAEIASTQLSAQSMMPEGLLSALNEDAVRDLFAYLRQSRQVPLPAEKP